MALGIIDAVAFRISRVLESLFDEIEYQDAKNDNVRMAKQRRKARRARAGYSENGSGKVTLGGLTQPHSAGPSR